MTTNTDKELADCVRDIGRFGLHIIFDAVNPDLVERLSKGPDIVVVRGRWMVTFTSTHYQATWHDDSPYFTASVEDMCGYMPHPHDLFDVGWWANNEGLKTVRSACRFEYQDNHVYLKARLSMDIHVFMRRQDTKYDYFPCSSGAPWE
jgi:hypothetical protein